MPKYLILPCNTAKSEGIEITWTPSAQRLDFSGWYDSIVGIEGASMFLFEFFERLGIKKRDCIKAFEKYR